MGCQRERLRDAGLHALLAGFRERESPQDRGRKHAGVHLGRQRSGQSALLRSQTQQERRGGGYCKPWRTRAWLTDPSNAEIVNNGGPDDIQALVKGLGDKVSMSKAATITKLSSGVQLISKPSKLQVPVWQLVSSLLDGQSLRAATWWSHPSIPTTKAKTTIGCWDASLKKPGAVDIATTGTWNKKAIGLEGIPKKDGNHAKIGVTTSGHPYAIFGDMNQQGTLDGPSCKSSQNGRGWIVLRGG